MTYRVRESRPRRDDWRRSTNLLVVVKGNLTDCHVASFLNVFARQSNIRVRRKISSHLQVISGGIDDDDVVLLVA